MTEIQPETGAATSSDAAAPASSHNKKLTLPSEVVWLVSLVLLALSVAMVGAASFGYSSVVAPAFVFSQGVGALTFGQSEYVVQGVLFVLLCIIVGKIRVVYLSAFGTCLVYGFILDLWRRVVPLFNPLVTEPGSMAMPVRIFLFSSGIVLTAFSVALSFHTYLLPQVNDFFVKAITTEKKVSVTKFKLGYDLSSLAVALLLSVVFFGEPFGHGIGAGTVVIACVNGFLIGAFDKFFTRFLCARALLPKWERAFAI